MIANNSTAASIPLAEAWDDIKEYGYYPVPFHQAVDETGELVYDSKGKPVYNFPHGVTGGGHDLQYVPVRPNDTFIGFRLPHDVIALDVDHHDEKTGADHLDKFIADHGLPVLPSTYRITSRGPGDRGKLLFRVPGEVGTDLYFRQHACPDVEILTSRHMFVGGYPRTPHQKTGELNSCYGPDGEPCDLPYAFDLPELPEVWVNALTKDPAVLADVTAAVPVDDGLDCPVARSWWQGYQRTELTQDGFVEVVKQGADFTGGQVRGAREWNATVFLKTLAIHGHHVGKVIAEACAASRELEETIEKRWDDAKGHATDDRDCCKEGGVTYAVPTVDLSVPPAPEVPEPEAPQAESVVNDAAAPAPEDWPYDWNTDDEPDYDEGDDEPAPTAAGTAPAAAPAAEDLLAKLLPDAPAFLMQDQSFRRGALGQLGAQYARNGGSSDGTSGGMLPVADGWGDVEDEDIEHDMFTFGTRCIFRQGYIHTLFGESGAAKSFIAAAAAAQVVRKGRRVGNEVKPAKVCWYNYDDSKANVYRNLRLNGLSDHQIREYVHIVNDAPKPPDSELPVLAAYLGAVYSLVVFDAFGTLLETWFANADSNNTDQVARVYKRLYRRVADAGCAVLSLDHLPKDASNNKVPFGSIAKKNNSDVLYRADKIVGFTKTQPGYTTLTCRKDRTGTFDDDFVVGYYVRNGKGEFLCSQDVPTPRDLNVSAVDIESGLKTPREKRRELIREEVTAYQRHWLLTSLAQELAERHPELGKAKNTWVTDTKQMMSEGILFTDSEDKLGTDRQEDDSHAMHGAERREIVSATVKGEPGQWTAASLARELYERYTGSAPESAWRKDIDRAVALGELLPDSHKLLKAANTEPKPGSSKPVRPGDLHPEEEEKVA